MDAKSGQFQKSFLRNWSNRTVVPKKNDMNPTDDRQRNQMKQRDEMLTQQDHS